MDDAMKKRIEEELLLGLSDQERWDVLQVLDPATRSNLIARHPELYKAWFRRIVDNVLRQTRRHENLHCLKCNVSYPWGAFHSCL